MYFRHQTSIFRYLLRNYFNHGVIENSLKQRILVPDCSNLVLLLSPRIYFNSSKDSIPRLFTNC